MVDENKTDVVMNLVSITVVKPLIKNTCLYKDVDRIYVDI